MENDQPVSPHEAQDSLDALANVHEENVARLQRPRRYWATVGMLFAVYALFPLTSSWTPLVTFLLVPALLVVIFIFATWKQPSAVRNIKLTGTMWLPLLGFAVLAGVLGGLNTALYNAHGWWWLPPFVALLLFAGAVVGGPLIDRYWARTVSNRD